MHSNCNNNAFKLRLKEVNSKEERQSTGSCYKRKSTVTATILIIQSAYNVPGTIPYTLYILKINLYVQFLSDVFTLCYILKTVGVYRCPPSLEETFQEQVP